MPTNPTHGNFEDIISDVSPDLQAICTTLRELIVSLHASYVEIVWPAQSIASFGVGPKKMSQHYAYISVHNSHVNLGFYHGASLADSDNLLEGTGTRLRHVKVRSLQDLKQPAIRSLLAEAIANRQRANFDTPQAK